MRFYRLLAATIAVAVSTGAHAQVNFTAAMIGQAMLYRYQNATECYNGRWKPTPEKIALWLPRAEPALAAYLSAGGVQPPFWPARKVQAWRVDGEPSTFAAVSALWPTRVVRVEQRSFTLNNRGGYARVVWTATAPDGTQLGTYDAYFVTKGDRLQLLTMDAYTQAGLAKQLPIKPFCEVPGDVEHWQEERDKAAAARAAKAARRAAAATSQQAH